MIIAIDGPAGSGKSTTARAVARRLDFRHLDSGAFYRALTLAALRSGIPPAEWDGLDPQALEAFDIQAHPDDGGFRLTWAGRDLTADLRDPAVNAEVSRMARIPTVRQWLLDRLRTAADSVDLVADGRDIGTVVFPRADLKVFLVADAGERARRRLAEQGKPDPDAEELAAERQRLETRDRLDSERTVAPLRQAEDAVRIDTTGLSFEEQVDRIVELARRRGAATPGSTR